MKVSAKALHYFNQLSQKKGLAIRIPHVGKFWMGMSIHDINEELSNAERKCYLKHMKENTYALCDVFDNELAQLTMSPSVSSISVPNIEQHIEKDPMDWSKHSINGLSIKIDKNTAIVAKAPEGASDADLSGFEEYKNGGKTAAITRAREFETALTKPTCNMERQRLLCEACEAADDLDLSDKSEIKAEMKRIEYRMNDLYYKFTDPQNDMMRIQNKLDETLKTKEKLMSLLWNKCDEFCDGKRRTLKDFEDQGYVSRGEDGIPVLETGIDMNTTGYIYVYNPPHKPRFNRHNGMYENTGGKNYEAAEQMLKFLKNNGVHATGYYTGEYLEEIICTFTDEDIRRTGIRFNYPQWSYQGEKQVLSSSGAKLNAARSLLESYYVQENIRSIRKINKEISDIEARLDREKEKCAAVEVFNTEYKKLKYEYALLKKAV